MSETRLRYYYVARTAHIERLDSLVPAAFFYSRVREDFDADLARRAGAVRKSLWGVVATIMRDRPTTVELPEPLAWQAWPALVVIHAAVGIGRIFGVRTQLVSYAIENVDVGAAVASRLRTPVGPTKAVVRLLLRFLFRTSTRVVFGTEAARANYRSHLSAADWTGVETDLVWALTGQDRRAVSGDRRPSRVVFLGTFVERKGIQQVLAAWAYVLEMVPDAELVLLGKAGDTSRVREFARRRPEVQLLEDPSRERIFEVLRSSHVLVLFSQPTSTWKEQVGLPILEGLSAGCEIVSSDQTGIADWLRANGHRVIDWRAGPQELASAMADAIRNNRTADDVMAALPRVDPRVEADRRLFGVCTGEIVR